MSAPRRRAIAIWLWVALAPLCVLSGCDGCRRNPLVERKDETPDIDDVEAKKKKEKPKEDFDFRPPRVLPDLAEVPRSFVKPGHWVTVRNYVRANNFDFQGELHATTTDSLGRPLPVQNTGFDIGSSRPVPLPKGQERAIDVNFFVPMLPSVTEDLQPRSVWLARELRAARGGRLVKEDVRQGTAAMPAYQYYLVALTDDPDRYSYLRSLPTVAAFAGPTFETEKLVYYRVVVPELNPVAPLPNHALTWTSIAYVLWDDVSDDILTSTQQQAMLDWLHWGGQLIISGPNSLERLRGTFLEPYLPATAGQTTASEPSDLEEVNRFWTLVDKEERRKEWSTTPEQPLLVVQLDKHPEAEFVPRCGRLVVERRVGSGRVVATAFSLSDSQWLAWKSLDNFMNGAILRRPRREFRITDHMPESFWADYDPAMALDPRCVSTLRYFTRDVEHFSSRPGTTWEPDEKPPDLAAPTTFGFGSTGSSVQSPARPPAVDESEDWHFRGFARRWMSGMAAWSDRSGPSDAAREALKDASGITVPRGDFVLKILAIYLTVLAPLNWLVFRAAGRVEWAWAAAPVIAILGTFAVVRLARLDIGFARSFTEISIAEMQGDYPRAHVTRYIALYTSLSTSYDLEFTDDGALAQPFAASEGSGSQSMLPTTTQRVSLRRDKQLKLTGLTVNSNTEGFVHCEQMSDMGGGFALEEGPGGEFRLRNGTDRTLHGVGILRRTEEGERTGAWVGELAPRTSVPVRFAALAEQFLPQWNESPVTGSHNRQVNQLLEQLDADENGSLHSLELQDHPLAGQFALLDVNANRLLDRGELRRWFRLERSGELTVGSLLELATSTLLLLPGEIRLLGWSDDILPGVVAQPEASQSLRKTLFVVHLRAGRMPTPQSDERLASDFIQVEAQNSVAPGGEPKP
ncbi:MAG: hypothetical protein AB7O38_20990 [Pirellulaceae bacterium]